MFDDGGQSRIVNVHDVMDAGAIYTRVLHKFNITDDMEKYSMFTLGETGDGTSRRLDCYFWGILVLTASTSCIS